MNFNLVFVLYSCLLGLIVGALVSLFLALSNLLIHVTWTTIPEQLDTPFYPFWICLFGGLLIGLFQTYIGDYPRTMHQTLEEFKTTGRVAYEGAVVKNTVAALLVLTFGASLGPEAALISILGGLMTWAGDRMTWTLQKKKELLDLGIGAMLSTIFYAPLIGVSEALEDGVNRTNFKRKSIKVLLYALTTACGIFAFTTLNRLFPHEILFSISTPKVNWTVEVMYFLLPAVMIGTGFGYLFVMFGRWTDAVARKYPHPLGLALTAGAILGLFGSMSSYFLFSGEQNFVRVAGRKNLSSSLFQYGDGICLSVRLSVYTGFADCSQCRRQLYDHPETTVCHGNLAAVFISVTILPVHLGCCLAHPSRDGTPDEPHDQNDLKTGPRMARAGLQVVY